MSETSYSFGNWLRRRRKMQDLTQKELAARAYCSINTIKKIETDQRRPSRGLAQSLAAALSLPGDQLEIFIECARGQRPVDHLDRESGHSEAGSTTVQLRPITPSPLPVVSTRLIGRETELKMLNRLLAETWLVTIVGVGGIGKTRLALAVASEWQRAGQTTIFIPLTGVKPDENLAAAIVESLGLRLLAGSDPTSQLLAYLAQKELLLVLDNFEHLLDSAQLLTQMHQAAPGLTLLVTSRQRLALPSEQLLPLQGLHFPQGRRQLEAADLTEYPAVQLFLQNARRFMPGFTPDNDDALLHLLRVTDGLPLALELAAAWAKTLTLPDLVQTLTQNLDLLTLEEPSRPVRHHSMRAVFDTTWQFLGDAEREAFARLSVFRGGFTRQAAEAIADISLSNLSNLVGRSLVQLDHTNGRYTLHELMRQYTAEKLARTPDTESKVRRRHATFFCDFLAARDADLKSANQEEVLAEIRAERANIWSAWHWAASLPQKMSLVDAIAPLGNACHLRNWVEDGYKLFSESVRDLSPYRDRPGILLSLLHLNVWRLRFVHWMGWPVDTLLEDIRQSLVMVPPSPTLRGVLALYHLVAEEVFLDAGERETARKHGEQALGLYESINDEWGQANALAQLGTVCWNVGAYDEAQDYFKESLTLRRQIGDRRGIAHSLDRVGLLLMVQGQPDLSSRYLEQAVDLFKKLGDRSGLAGALQNLGSAWLHLGRWENVQREYAAAAALHEELGLRHLGYTVLKALTAYTSAHAGNYPRAVEEAKTAVALSQEWGHKRSEGLALMALGIASMAMGDDATAAMALAVATSYLREINQLDELALAIGVQALVAYRQGEVEKAQQNILSSLAIVSELRGILSSPDYALAVWSLILADRGKHEQADDVYQLVLAEPVGAASRWFADMCGRFVPHSPPLNFMLPEERWIAIAQLYQSLQSGA